MKSGDPYEKIRKVYSVNIVYFDLGQGNDYVYHGTTRFVSMHDESDKQDYYRMMESRRYQRSVIETGSVEGRAEGRETSNIQHIAHMLSKWLEDAVIADLLELLLEYVDMH